MKMLFPAILLLIFAVPLKGEIPVDKINSLRNNIVLVKTDLYIKIVPPSSIVKETADMLAELNNAELTASYNAFAELYRTNPSADTLLSLFNNFSFRFYNDYSAQLYSEVSSSEKLKIILFVASLSCECTLRQSAEFEHAVYNAYKNKPAEIDFTVVDFMNDDTIQDSYDVSFIPVMIILDKENQELTRFTAEDGIQEKLNNFFSERELK